MVIFMFTACLQNEAYHLAESELAALVLTEVMQDLKTSLIRSQFCGNHKEWSSCSSKITVNQSNYSEVL